MIPTLTTKRLTLRPFKPSDAADVQRLAGEREVAATTLNIAHPYEDGMAESWIADHEKNWSSGTTLTLAITTAADGLVGAISLKLTVGHNSAELGYWIGVPYWGRGYATEAARAIVDFGFKDIGLSRIHAHFLADNVASGRVMEKLGMRHEGVLRQHIVKWGERHDVVLYGILASDLSI